jgi:hypothetical protein
LAAPEVFDDGSVGGGRLNPGVTAVDLAQRLPGIATVRGLSRSFALLDAILSPATWPGLVESVPREFAAQVTEPAFCHDGGTGPFLAATVCLWRLPDDPAWKTGDIDFRRRDE